MKIPSEVRIGFIGIVTAAVVFWGIHYLRGKNILSSTTKYYATFENVNGLESAAPVIMKGYKIGSVDEIIFYPESTPPFLVSVEIEKDYKINLGSIAEIYSADLLGSKAIRIKYSANDAYYSEHDTLLSGVVPDMVSNVMSEFTPLLEHLGELTQTLDSAGKSINRIVNSKATTETINSLNKVAGSLQKEFSESGNIATSLDNLSSITANLKNQNEEIASTIKNLQAFSNDLESSGIDSILVNLDAVSKSIKNITQQIESGEGSAGKFIYNDSFYTHISSLSADLDSLVKDINSNPEKYVRFSVFGK